VDTRSVPENSNKAYMTPSKTLCAIYLEYRFSRGG